MTETLTHHPVQTEPTAVRRYGKAAVVPAAVALRAYEVYVHCHREQEALITGGCRGGFSDGELVAFLYARSFPKVEWRQRVQEAFDGMTL